MMMRLLFVLLVVFVMPLPVVAGTTTTPQSQVSYLESEVTITKFRPLSRKVSLTRQQFEGQTVLVNMSVAQDPLLSTSIRLPKDWTKDSQEVFDVSKVSASVLSPILKYVSPIYVDLRAYFVLYATKLSYKMTAEDWFANYTVTQGLVVEGVRITSEKQLEAQYTRIENQRSYFVRARVIINGNKLIFAEYVLPSAIYAKNKDSQIWSVLSLQLSQPSATPIEKFKNFSFLGLAEFIYPETWSTKAPDIKDPTRFMADVISTSRDIDVNINQRRFVKLEGKIGVRGVAKKVAPDLKTEIALLKGDLEKQGFVIGKVLRKPKFTFQKDIKNIETNVYLLEDKNKKLQNYEYAIGILESSHFYFIVTSFSPLQENDFLGWARNREAYKTVIQSIK